MVKLIAAMLAVLASTAHADDSPAFNMFGFRMSAGALPLDGNRSVVLSLGLGVEHPVFKKVRMFGEYEWLWINWYDERAMDSVVIRPAHHGNGHRASLGLRRELVGKNAGRRVRIFLDGELGANVALTTDNMHGMAFRPGSLVGLRFGYDVYSGVDSSPSRTFEAEVLVRAITVAGGAGVMVGMGLAWGN